MKLNEIFDTETVDNLKGDNTERLGTGAFSTVYQSGTDPHMVNRIGKTPEEKAPAFKKREDGYNVYAEAIIKSKINQSNPAFPRIYKKANGQFQIEKLTPIVAIRQEELLNYLINNFNVKEEDYESEEDRKQKAIAADIVGIISSSLRWADFDKIKNEYLKQAIQWIDELIQKSNSQLRADIHGGNIMFRRTSVGIQLVITDPVY